MTKTTQLFSALLLVSAVALAQTPSERAQIVSHYNMDKLNALKTEFSAAEAENRARAYELAAIYDWPTTIQSEFGGIASLIGVYENGQPKYRVSHNREGGITTRANTLHTGGATNLDLNGENMIVGEWDGGGVRATHQLLVGRVDQRDGAAGTGDHATHVAGTMIGNGDVVNGAAKGMLPEGTLWAHDWFSDYPEMITAAGEGLLVSNHSYGAGIQNLPLWRLGYYDADARGMDNITYNAPYYLPVVSAGNDRQSGVNTGDGGFDYLTDMGTAKNNLVVAATFEVLNYTGPSSVSMSGFSSWGPTDDGRIKPDISGKGVNMYSSLAGSNQAYANYSGTSMASPNVAGSLMLLQQYYNQLNGSYMNSASLRGLSLHTADEAGSADGPDYRFGWGLLNVQRGAEVIGSMNNGSYIIEDVLASGETMSFAVNSNGSDDLMGSITWTDAPGVMLPGNASSEDDPTPMLINDLDMRMTTPGGDVYAPWKLDPFNFAAAATTGDNIVDNIEKIEVPGALGAYYVTISHKGANLLDGQQAVSIILTGLATSDFFASTHNGRVAVCEGDDTALVAVDFLPLNGYADGVTFGVSSLPSGVSGTFSDPTLSTEGTSNLELSGMNNLATGDYVFLVQVVGVNETQEFPVTVTVLGSSSADVPVADLLVPEDEAIDIPIVYELSWTDEGQYVVSYDLEVSRNIDFTDVEFAQSSEFNSSLVLGMQEGYTYWWRVRGNTDCAQGDFSEPFTFTVAGVLGTTSQESMGLSLYPNPAETQFTVASNAPIEKLEIRNVLGQSVYQMAVNSNQAQVDVAGLASGTYFVRVYREGSVANLKLVKR